MANLNRIIIAQININSIRDRSDALVSGIKGNVDILMISETKIDNSFPTRQFLINGYTAPYCLDRNSVGGGILVHAREDTPSKLISVNLQNREQFFLEINLRRKKWIIGFSYNPHVSSVSDHVDIMRKSIDFLSTITKNSY